MAFKIHTALNKYVMKQYMKLWAHIEVSKNSRQKYEFNGQRLVLDRLLKRSIHYPYNYGYIENTLADDGDPLDVMIISSESLLPNTWVEIEPIGYLNMEDEKGMDQKVIAKICNDPETYELKDISGLSTFILDEIKIFFETYKNNDNNKWSRVYGWFSKEDSLNLIKICQENSIV